MTNWYQTHDFNRLSLSSDSTLPALSVIALDNLALVTAVGQDTVPYLQGQLTCDLVSLEKTRSTLQPIVTPKVKYGPLSACFTIMMALPMYSLLPWRKNN